MIVPVPEQLAESFKAAQRSDYNFGLWYNKYVPRVDPFEKKRGDRNYKVDYQKCLDEYKKISGSDLVKKLLAQKHEELGGFCRYHLHTHILVEKKGKLISPLITGIGESHPGEVGMLFDHTLGIPYVGASSLKGIHRLFFAIGGLADSGDELLQEKDTIDDDAIEDLTATYGSNERRGGVIFLDAYPEEVPELQVDIMNPHYNKYYGSIGKNPDPPRDNENPIPIKFLTIKPGSVFVFRALVRKDLENSERIAGKVERYLDRILSEGIGAKTALGYGRFTLMNKKASPDKPEVRSIKYRMGESYLVTVVNVSPESIRVLTQDGINVPIGKRKARTKDSDDMEKLYHKDQRIRGVVIGYNRKGEPQFKVEH